MRNDPVGGQHIQGEESRSYLIGSDLHTDRPGTDADEMIATLEAHADEYDCDGILAPGDLGEEDTVDAFYETDVDTVRIAFGNHDDFDQPDEKYMTDGGNVIIDDRIDWTLQVGDRVYQLAMSHKARDFGFSTTEMYETGLANDIMVYGHGHCPLDRPLDGSLAVSAGSLIQNYNVDTDQVPETSAYVVELYEDRVELTHIDFETGETVEMADYVWDDDELVEDQRQWTWSGDRLDYIVEGGRSTSMKEWIDNQ